MTLRKDDSLAIYCKSITLWECSSSSIPPMIGISDGTRLTCKGLAANKSSNNQIKYVPQHHGNEH